MVVSVVPLLSKSSLEDLQRFLKPFWPRSVLPSQVAKLTSDGYIPESMRPRLFVDTWPSPNIVWSSVMESAIGHKKVCMFTVFATNPGLNLDVDGFCREVGKSLGLFGKGDQAFGFIIKEGNVTDQVIRCFRRNERESRVGLDHVMTLWWTNPYRNYLKGEPVVPPDLYVSELKESEWKMVDSAWPHRCPGSDLRMREKIRLLPNLCLRQKSDDTLVGWELTAFLGYTNHIFIDPTRRGQGLMQIIQRLMTKKRLELGFVPFAMVLHDNMASLSAMKKGRIMEQAPCDVDIVIMEPRSRAPNRKTSNLPEDSGIRRSTEMKTYIQKKFTLSAPMTKAKL